MNLKYTLSCLKGGGGGGHIDETLSIQNLRPSSKATRGWGRVGWGFPPYGGGGSGGPTMENFQSLKQSHAFLLRNDLINSLYASIAVL